MKRMRDIIAEFPPERRRRVEEAGQKILAEVKREMSGKRILEGLKEAVAVAKGDQPAARIHVNGHAYVPEDDLKRARALALKFSEAHDRAEDRAAEAEHALMEKAEMLVPMATIVAKRHAVSHAIAALHGDGMDEAAESLVRLLVYYSDAASTPTTPSQSSRPILPPHDVEG